MLVRRIITENFCALGSAVLELPETGVTVLTGPNGAGKSRFAEAVAYALWGETLRDASPWHDGVAGRVLVETTVGLAERNVTAKGTKGLKWNGDKADTPTRTQEIISSCVPEYKYWQRCHVFSSNAAQFSLATDGERKRIVEQLLGLDVFDRAQKACSEALYLAEMEVGRVAAMHGVADMRRAGAQIQLDVWGTWPPFSYPPAPEEPERPTSVQQLLDELERQRGELAALEQTMDPRPLQGLQRNVDAAKAAQRRAEERLSLARRGRCDQCEQEWHGASVGDLVTALQVVQSQVQAARDDEQREQQRRTLVGGQMGVLQRALAELMRQLEAAGRRHAMHDAWGREHGRWKGHEELARKEWEQGRQLHEAKRKAALATVAEATDERDELKWSLNTGYMLRAELEAAAQVLGVKGLRGHVLGHALHGVEFVANYWLQQIAPGKALTVRSEGEQGKIVLGLQGYGGGAYKAASSGERRRVDAPLLLALAEVAGAGERGTLFLDEIFDALDVEGQLLVARALGELGMQQSVVVITHSEDLARSVPADQRYRVDAGQIVRM